MIRAALLAATAVAASLLGCAGEKPQVLRPVATPIAAPAAPAVVSRATPVAGAIPAGQASAAVDALNAELVRRLRPDANQAALRIARLPDGALRVILAADVTFEVDSAQMRAETLERIADCAAAAQAPGAFVVHVLGEDDAVVSLPTRTPMVFTPDGRSLIIQAAHAGKPQLFLRSLGHPDARPKRPRPKRRRCDRSVPMVAPRLSRRTSRRFIGRPTGFLFATAFSTTTRRRGAVRIS